MERDPQNVLLARQSRFRLESEIIRDVYLTAGGLLNSDIAGRSVRPQMPEDVKALASLAGVQWVESDGVEKYRRGLYICAQRTWPYPVSMSFDQANPSETCPRREQSNTPLQALTLLNHGLFVECAQALGRRMLGNAGLSERIESGFELCVARKPTPQELARLEKLYDDQLQLARKHRETAAQLAGVAKSNCTDFAETAALVVVAQTLLNLDEFITRE
jgi:hypothetical protein